MCKVTQQMEVCMKALRNIIITILFVLLTSCAFAESVSFNSVNEAIKYIKKNQPIIINITNVKFKPTQLLKIKSYMPEGSDFHFTTTWGNVTFSDDVVDLDLRPKDAGISRKELEAVIQLCPYIKSIDNANKMWPSNNDMIPLINKYPDIRFEWMVNLGNGHHISTKCTAYSTMNKIGSGKELTSRSCELLKYCPRLKALDLGHNKITNLDFLQYTPELELLIVADNKITDITPIGQLTHLKYLELFKNNVTDLSPLSNCKELLDLNITWLPVTDLSPLYELNSLERLWANMMRKLPESEIEAYKSKHPETITDFQISHAATVDGWREHPRYKHYISCFKNYKWIPFDENTDESKNK